LSSYVMETALSSKTLGSKNNAARRVPKRIKSKTVSVMPTASEIRCRVRVLTPGRRVKELTKK